MIVVGLDLSKNHYAMVMKDLSDNAYRVCFGWNSRNKVDKWKKNHSGMSIHYLPGKDKDSTQDTYDIMAAKYLISALSSDFLQFDPRSRNQWVIALEGYAYSSNAAVGLAEITGQVKAFLFDKGYAIRIHDPLSVKMWAGKGNYDKEQMLDAARQHVPISEDFSDTKTNPAHDMADAFFLKTMMEWEIKIRRYPQLLDRLSTDKKRLFNRVTKANPMNLLVRPFLAKDQPHFGGRKRR